MSIKTDSSVTAPPLPSSVWLLSMLVGGAVAFYVIFYFLTWLLARAPEPIGTRSDLFVEGARMTLYLSLGAGAAGLLVGTFVGLAKISKTFLLRAPAEFFVWIMRGTPLLVQILFAYYALPALTGLQLSEFSAALVALALNVGAYNAEVIRAGIEAIPKGQSEAALSVGLSRLQCLCFVVMPQAFRIVIPPLVNNLVALLKDSSLASSIGLLELTLAGTRVSSETFLPVPVLTTVALVYLCLTTAVTTFSHFLERRLQ